MATGRTAGSSPPQQNQLQQQNDPRVAYLIVTFLPVCLLLVYDATGQRWRNNKVHHDDAPNLLSPTACYYAAALLGAVGGYGATSSSTTTSWEVPLGIVCGMLGYASAVWAGSSYLLSQSVGGGEASDAVVVLVTIVGGFPGLALFGFCQMLLTDPFERPRRRRRREERSPANETEGLIELRI